MIVTTIPIPTTDNPFLPTSSLIVELRKLLCLRDTPSNRAKIMSLCTRDIVLEVAEYHIPGISTWIERQKNAQEKVEIHGMRWDKETNYSQCSFKEKDLSNLYLVGAKLDFANLRESDLSGADLRFTDLRGGTDG